MTAAMHWGDYYPYVPPVLGMLQKMSRKDARACYNHRMATLDERRAAIRELLRVNGTTWADSALPLFEVDRWFSQNAERDPEDPERLAPEWYNVAYDLGILVEDLLLERCPTLRREFCTSRTADYQCPVLTGLAAPMERVTYNLFWRISAYGLRASGSDPDAEPFLPRITAIIEKHANDPEGWRREFREDQRRLEEEMAAKGIKLPPLKLPKNMDL